MQANVGVGDLVDGKYRILRLLGEGGWGVVFEGENTRTLKKVAIKVLRPQSNVANDSLARFEREAQAAGRIGSDHIVEVFDLGVLQDDTHYMVMELLNGEDLATRIDRLAKLPPIDTIKMVVQLLDGLRAAHEAGILHRDLKPENLFLVKTKSGEDFVKILDFGISKFSSLPSTNATATGAVLGSPCYMAPEQARGLRQIDARTDLYAVGVVIYECVLGQVPFGGDNFNDLMFNIVLSPRPNPLDLDPTLDPKLAAIISKSLALDPNDRFPTAEQFRNELIAWLGTQGVTSVEAPDARRIPARTPSTNDAPRLPTPIANAAANAEDWSGATMRVDSAANPLGVPPVSATVVSRTPMASTGPVVAPKRSGARVAVIVALAAAAVGVGFVASRHGATAADPPASSSNALAATNAPPLNAPPPPLASAKASSDPLPAEIVPAVATTNNPPIASSAPSAMPAVAPVHAAHASHASAPAVVAAAPPPVVTAPAPAPPPAAPDPKPAAPKPPTVEGRTIRTGL